MAIQGLISIECMCELPMHGQFWAKRVWIWLNGTLEARNCHAMELCLFWAPVGVCVCGMVQQQSMLQEGLIAVLVVSATLQQEGTWEGSKWPCTSDTASADPDLRFNNVYFINHSKDRTDTY